MTCRCGHGRLEHRFGDGPCKTCPCPAWRPQSPEEMAVEMFLAEHTLLSSWSLTGELQLGWLKDGSL